jgi:hypothetical protein
MAVTQPIIEQLLDGTLCRISYIAVPTTRDRNESLSTLGSHVLKFPNRLMRAGSVFTGDLGGETAQDQAVAERHGRDRDDSTADEYC